MEKINHAERVRGEAKEQTTYCGAAFFDGLVEQAAGYQEAEAGGGLSMLVTNGVLARKWRVSAKMA